MRLTSQWLTPDEGEEQMHQKVVMELMVQGIKQWIIREQPQDPYAMAELMQVYLVSEKT